MESQPVSHASLKASVSCALFAALMIVGGYISVPIGPVPIVLTDFFVMLAAVFLGWKYALGSVALYLLLGFVGLPVFAGGKAGLAVLVGPTGGFLVAYPIVVVIIGALVQKGGNRPLAMLGALLVGNVCLYAIGVTWLKVLMGIDWSAALAAGLIPFIPGTILKIVFVMILAVPLSAKVSALLIPKEEPVAPL